MAKWIVDRLTITADSLEVNGGALLFYDWIPGTDTTSGVYKLVKAFSSSGWSEAHEE